ncbi:phospholipase A [Jeongeupia wiesaeckerbachi]|uniref:phospholipase A n=1 Tax=Jeongeupia wiesaeckerbachi TaxID=3051218 RepID=UPI003D806632
MRVSRLIGLTMLAGGLAPLYAAETVFLPTRIGVDDVEVLFVNRGETPETFVPPAQLVCPGGIDCSASEQTPLQLPPASAKVVRYRLVPDTAAVDQQVAEAPPQLAPDWQIRNTSLADYKPQRFSAYEPMFIVVDPSLDDARFQFSFKYQFFDPENDYVQRHPWLAGLRFAYTQTSLWDIGEDSSPFFDTSYQPEFYYEQANVLVLPGVRRTDVAIGYRHESNGQGGDASRSLNQLFIRPSFLFGDQLRWNLLFQPMIYTYLGSLSDNPDIADYRGYVDWRLRAGDTQGWMISTLARLGKGGKGGVELNLSYPLRAFAGMDLYAYLQYWNGYGESLRTYDENTQSLRFGVSFTR